MFVRPVAKSQTGAATSSITQLTHRCPTLRVHRLGGGSVEQTQMPERAIGDGPMVRPLAQRGSQPNGERT